MTIPSVTIKGLQDIRSHSGRAREGAIPYKAYMRLSCLEMEKFRRARERESAMVRVRNIDARFQEIDSEEAMILRAIKKQDKTGPSDPSGGDNVDKHLVTGNNVGFRFKY
ncbi:MAG: hypothetical protein ABSF52_07745 [Syntrophobacteraceae bacterium]|jgi:hypothetical protein